MTPKRWGQLEELYQAARALPPSERTALLERADPEVRAAVESLLAQESVPSEGAFRESLLEHADPFQATTAMNLAGGPAPAQLGPGSRLGRYQLEALLGEGGMGQVFRARDTRLGRPVAIKMIHAERGRSPDFLTRFQREARATAALNHPHICSLYDAGEQEGTSY